MPLKTTLQTSTWTTSKRAGLVRARAGADLSGLMLFREAMIDQPCAISYTCVFESRPLCGELGYICKIYGRLTKAFAQALRCK